MKNPLKGALARARFRQQPAPLRFAIADRVDFLVARDWDAVTAHRGLFLSRGYLRELAAARPQNLDLRFALLYRDDEPVAALVLQLVELDGAQLHGPATGKGLRGLVSRAVTKVVDRIHTRILVVGNLLTYGNHGIAIRPGLEADPAVWHGIGEAAYRVRRAEKHVGTADFVLVKDLDDAGLEQSALLRDLGFRPIATEPDMVLDLDAKWRSYDDYLAALTGKYRKNVKSRVLTPIDAAGLSVRDLPDVAAAAPRLHELYLAVHANAPVRPMTLAPDYWTALARSAGDRLRCAVVARDERLLGFVMTVRADDTTALAYHIGFDREAAADAPLYLRLLHRTVADGIALGARRLSFGRTALEPKAALGAKPAPLHVWVRHRQGVLNKLLRGLLGRIHPEAPPERNPFPEASS
ncbi:MAG: GNAT family N-acetyltransferase [Planctomycetes bacterium]|nr:GNAT family N-acetyltransferase [Planctomycetota bacterium]